MTVPTIATCPLCGDPGRVFTRLVDVGLVCDGCRSRLVALVRRGPHRPFSREARRRRLFGRRAQLSAGAGPAIYGSVPADFRTVLAQVREST